MRNRLKIAQILLKEDGFICIHLNDSEMAYCKIALDEVFSRENYRNTISLSTNDPSGFKATGNSIFSTANFILIYSKNYTISNIKKTYIEQEYDEMYRYVLTNKQDPYEKWQWRDISEIVAQEQGFASKKEAKKQLKEKFNILVAEFALKNADRVFRTAAIGGGARIKRIDTINKSKANKGKVFVHPNEDILDFYILNGEGIVFYEKKVFEIDNQKVPGHLITDIWTDISWNGIANEGGITLKNGKKPERLMERVIKMLTDQNDIVLDYHLGSGTTCAVAHKMGRKYIGIEQLDYGNNDSVVRLNNVLKGDQTGISKSVNWQGGGDFIYLELAKWNEEAKEKILNAKNLDELIKLFDELYERYFLNYNVKTKEFKEKIVKEEDFKKLSLEEQKKLFVEMLDMNQMYVNFSERNDKKYGLSADDIEISEMFYSK